MEHPDPRRGVSKGLHARGRERLAPRSAPQGGTTRTPDPHGLRARRRGAIPLAAEMLLKRIWAGLSRSW